MKVGNQKMVLALILVFCPIASYKPPLLLHAGRPCLAAVLNQTADTKQEQDANPESFEKLAERAQAAMESESVPEAIRLYDSATQLRPDWPEGWWHLGTL
jgi:hypothetical protein